MSLKKWDGVNPLTGKDWNNNINALALMFAQGLPIYIPPSSEGVRETSYDGQWLSMDQKVSGHYPAFMTNMSYQKEDSKGYAPNKPDRVLAGARVKIDTDSAWFPFFYEPHKGNYANFQGFHVTTVHRCESRKGGAELVTTIDPQDWTLETHLRIWYFKGEKVQFYVDDALLVEHTDPTYISDSPFELCASEPDGSIRKVYLKFPPGIAHLLAREPWW